MTVSLLPIAAATYEPSDLHARDRDWTETNCYVDAWVEVLHSLGLDPVPSTACALSAGFAGDQWTFLKFDAEDLRELYGIDVAELNVWRPVVDHVVEHLHLGSLLTVEVDGWYLPDTAGVSYRLAHVKTTLVPQSVDLVARRLGYFHNAGYFELEGADFDGVFRLGPALDSHALPPYVELVRLDRIRRDDELVDRARAAIGRHLARRPEGNPVRDLGARVEADSGWLRSAGLDTFHLYAFGTLRQCGATAELAADLCDWLDRNAATDLTEAATDFRAVSTAMKTLQLQVARMVNGRTVHLGARFDDAALRWESAVDAVARRHAG